MNNKRSEQDPLRVAAEVELTHRAAATRTAGDPLHELQVHQIELEIQNETLCQTQIALEESRDRCADLYDFSPVAYLTLTAAGLISEVNLTGAALLKVERKKLLQCRFAQFVAREDRDHWHRRSVRPFQFGEVQNFELSLTRADGTVFDARIDYLHKKTNSGEHSVHIALTDITERKSLEKKFSESRQLLRELAEKTELFREEERKRIAREVHDELGQILTVLRMDVALINLRFGKQDVELLAKTQGMTELLDQAVRSVRNIVSNLRPTALDMGLVHAIRWLSNEFSAHGGSLCVFHTTEEHVEMGEGRAVAIFRIVQELLTNAARHADASNIEIQLARHADYLNVQVRDDGKGFNPAATPNNKSFGLLGIRERAIALGGHVEVVSAPCQGTKVTIVVPTEPKGDKP